jgi:alpha-beta hydrolase superfamily lysophospholipase
MPRELPKVSIKPMLILFACLVIALALLYVFQRRLIYFPTRVSHAQWEDEVRTIFGPQASVLAPYDALVIEPRGGTPVAGTAVWFHGNAGLALDRETFVPVFLERGLRLILAEYPGYGARDGAPTETALVDDASALYATVVQRYGDKPLLLIGESLGGGVAVQVAARRTVRPPSRLVLLTPFLSVAETAARVYWFLPARYLVRDKFDSVGQLANYAGPIAILVAGKDQVVGASQGRELAQRARARGEVISMEIAEAGHSSWPALLTEAQWSELLGLPALAASGMASAAGR